MISGKKAFGRLPRFAVAAIIAGSMCSLMQAQSASPKQGFNTPLNSPTAPVGTQFHSSDGTTTLTRPDTRMAQGVEENYRIGADDVLSINVWNEPQVSRNVPVRPDGKISLPLVGDVQAAGLTPMELRNDLAKRFRQYLTNPDVSVIVSQIRSQRINVLGQVLRPGTYALIPPMGVIDAIATAGGLKEFAKPNKAYVLRVLPNGHTERLKFKYNDVLKGKKGSKDILLQTRDTVVVP